MDNDELAVLCGIDNEILDSLEQAVRTDEREKIAKMVAGWFDTVDLKELAEAIRSLK